MRRTVTAVERYHWHSSPGGIRWGSRGHEARNIAVHGFFLCAVGAHNRKDGLDMKSNRKHKILSLALAAALGLSLTACAGTTPAPEGSTPPAEGSTAPSAAADGSGVAASGVEDGVLTVGMECAYAPYNWLQTDDSNGAVPISNVPGSYANGYDVQISKKIAEANGWELEIVSTAWDSLTPSLQSGTIDAAIAGQSMTAERMAEVDMAGPYYYATIVCLTNADSQYSSATGIADLAGGKCTAQSGTIWYDSCLPQIEGAQIQTAAETAPAMIVSLETKTVDFVCTDMPTAMGAVAKNPNLKVLDFSGTDGDFQFESEAERAENVNIGISVAKGNKTLLDAMNNVLLDMTKADFEAMMNDAIAIQPEI